MAQDGEDELEDAAQDRQDAVSDGCIEHFVKQYGVKGPSGVRRGSVKGSAWRDARPCSRLRLSGVCGI